MCKEKKKLERLKALVCRMLLSSSS